jgi:hypothetical protein
MESQPNKKHSSKFKVQSSRWSPLTDGACSLYRK